MSFSQNTTLKIPGQCQLYNCYRSHKTVALYPTAITYFHKKIGHQATILFTVNKSSNGLHRSAGVTKDIRIPTLHELLLLLYSVPRIVVYIMFVVIKWPHYLVVFQPCHNAWGLIGMLNITVYRIDNLICLQKWFIAWHADSTSILHMQGRTQSSK